MNETLDQSIEERIKRHLRLTDVAVEEPFPEEEDEVELPTITDEMQEVIDYASGARPDVVLVTAFSIDIKRKDLDTLKGLNWLNDEVINFYMNMICERSKEHDNWPNVYAYNTFFYSKIIQSGHAPVRRWTRKVDIFSYDLLLIPVHLGMHWCLAAVDFAKPGIYYYDSMGGNNTACLEAVSKYLEDEHKDKKKQPYDTSKFTKEIVKDIPQQNNSSDCGMFACKFAEYLSRRAKITFDQEDMPYFRTRMVYEIVKKDIMNP